MLHTCKIVKFNGPAPPTGTRTGKNKRRVKLIRLGMYIVCKYTSVSVGSRKNNLLYPDTKPKLCGVWSKLNLQLLCEDVHPRYDVFSKADYCHRMILPRLWQTGNSSIGISNLQ